MAPDDLPGDTADAFDADAFDADAFDADAFDAAGCGAAGSACCAAPAEPCVGPRVCTDGRCESCPAGTTRCESGCRALRSDPEHCGACGRACVAPPGSRARCIDGSCVVMRCGLADCDGDATNGAETDTQRDACNCGACGQACESLAGVAEARCVDCGCALLRCVANFGDCDLESGNGCEVDLRRDARHCGACGRACAEGEACVRGSCVAVARYTTCPTGSANLQNDRNHCGRCGLRCPDGQVCDRGACRPACPPATRTCGPETCLDLDTNPLHCGACGYACPDWIPCTHGSCVTSCGAGLTACAGTCRDLDNDPRFCGSCERTCDPGAVCRGGSCVTLLCRRRGSGP